MRIIMHHDKFYDWEPVPENVEVTQDDIKNRRVRPGMNGGWLARIQRELPEGQPTHTEVQLSEADVQNQIIRDAIREKVIRTRKEAVTAYLAQTIVGSHAHRSWMHEFEVDDTGPTDTEKDQFQKMVDMHVAARNLEPEDVDDLIKAYEMPAAPEEQCDHLHEHFKCGEKHKADTVLAGRARRAAIAEASAFTAGEIEKLKDTPAMPEKGEVQ